MGGRLALCKFVTISAARRYTLTHLTDFFTAKDAKSAKELVSGYRV